MLYTQVKTLHSLESGEQASLFMMANSYWNSEFSFNSCHLHIIYQINFIDSRFNGLNISSKYHSFISSSVRDYNCSCVITKQSVWLHTNMKILWISRLISQLPMVEAATCAIKSWWVRNQINSENGVLSIKQFSVLKLQCLLNMFKNENWRWLELF